MINSNPTCYYLPVLNGIGHFHIVSAWTKWWKCLKNQFGVLGGCENIWKNSGLFIKKGVLWQCTGIMKLVFIELRSVARIVNEWDC